MVERVIKAEIVHERITVCPQCRTRNRLYPNSVAGTYRCGTCRAALPDPFLPVAKRRSIRMRTLWFAISSVVAVLLLIASIAGVVKTWPASHEQVREGEANHDTIPASNKTVPLSGPAEAKVRLDTIAPLNNAILYNAKPWSIAKGELTVSNGAPSHAIAKLIDKTANPNRKVLSFVICAGQQSTVRGVPDGSYRLMFAFGDRLYRDTDRLESPRSFYEFDKTFSFNTTITNTVKEGSTYQDTQYWVVSVTLTPVVGGNITTSSISKDEFEKY